MVNVGPTSPGLSATPRRAWIELQGSADPRAWERQHAEGLVPDRTPYGLHRLAHYGVEPSFRLPRPGRVQDLLGRASRKLGGYSWYEVLRSRPPTTADVVVCWDERYGVPRAIRDGRSVPVATGVIWAPDASSWAGRIAARALRRAALVWVQSEPQLPVLRDEWELSPSRLAYVPFGVDVDFFRPDPSAEVDPNLVVSVGNDRHRDHRLLVDAVQLVRQTRPHTRLELVTRRAVPPAPGVRVHSQLSHADLRTLYGRAAAVAVVTRPNSHVSGATAFLEAMACARPVITIDNPGVSGYVTDECGIRVPPGDTEALAAGLVTLLDDPAHAEELARESREATTTRFSTEHQAEALAQLLIQRI